VRRRVGVVDLFVLQKSKNLHLPSATGVLNNEEALEENNDPGGYLFVLFFSKNKQYHLPLISCNS
jgi:hypothetical protein